MSDGEGGGQEKKEGLMGGDLPKSLVHFSKKKKIVNACKQGKGEGRESGLAS